MTEARIIVGGKEVRFLDEDDARARIDRADQLPSFPDEAAERAWWGEHTLSEEFWRNAEPVPEGELTPVRRRTPPSSAQPSIFGTVPPGVAFGVGFIACAALIGAAYLLFRLVQPGPATADFLPTTVPHLRISA